MTVNLQAPNPANILAVPGVRLGIAEAGVRKVGRKDLTVILLDEGSAVAGVFTQNRYCAAPVQVCREHLKQVTSAVDSQIRALVINTGNANAGTGEDGLVRAFSTCVALGRKLNIAPEQVLPFSTGVIMETLPNDRIEAGLPAALADLQPAHWAEAAEAIMTTDSVAKAASRQITIGGTVVTVTGIAKGSGTQVSDVNALIKQFSQMREMMRMMKGGKGKELMRRMGQMGGGRGGFPGGGFPGMR